ncbi:tRNA 2-thiouridine(34) synthase MnmA [Marinicellulosiphila megalodicopiae]|uniref:tRNA 2-thiouridine(34) synthase MnmA n=1 Tax=Marinicellulosiphila megalodicopiae TaxID=2724896 RepID=UPI003BB0E532
MNPLETKPATGTKVIVGMSGGVDSSVSAYLLMQQGYQVEGLFMKNWDEDDNTEYCTAKQDLKDAQAVCDTLGIKLHQANFASEYWDNVFELFLHEYKEGRTPNPDILCNKEIKFKVFLDYAKILGAQKIATGHYCRLRTDDQQTYLLRGLDTNKDQSYFLHAVHQDQLAQTLFPVGELEKPEVRRIAEEQNLITHNKKDSTGICFIGERRFKDFLQQYLPAQPGNIEAPNGDVIGKHTGLMYYTLGQRQGLQIGGLKNYPEAPWFVGAKDLDRNVLTAVQAGSDKMLYSHSLSLSEIDWVKGQKPELPMTLTCKHRYRQPDQDCVIDFVDGQYIVKFNEPQRAITPGQSAVFYDNDICLGGGVIEQFIQ